MENIDFQTLTSIVLALVNNLLGQCIVHESTLRRHLGHQRACKLIHMGQRRNLSVWEPQLLISFRNSVLSGSSISIL